MKTLLRVVWIALLAGCARVGAAGLQLDIEYGRAGGESLKLDAWVPEGAGPFPAVILVHGGGWTSGDKSGGPGGGYMAPMHAPLQRAGFAWFSIRKNFVALFDRKEADEPALALLREASPLPQVKRGLPPFLLVHGTADMTVPIAQSETMRARLRDAGVPVELLKVDGGVHGMLGWKAIAPDYQDRIVAWLQRTLAAGGGAKKR